MKKTYARTKVFVRKNAPRALWFGAGVLAAEYYHRHKQ
jgi:hypothetical protein